MTLLIESLRAELRTDSPDVATAAPRLSWVVRSSTPGWIQRSAELSLDDQLTVIVPGGESVLTAWPFDPIRPRAQHSVRVRVTGADGATSPWSKQLTVRAAFLAAGEWIAPMIAAPQPGQLARPVQLRKEFRVRTGLVRATLYATAQGVYQAYVNGCEVDEEVLKPGWTPYRSRLVHESTDVTHLLREGDNALAAHLAGGWYTERVGFPEHGGGFYGNQPAFAAQLLLEYQDGTTAQVLSGPEWTCTTDGPLSSSGLYDGDEYDARRERTGWDQPGFDDTGWSAVAVRDEEFPVPGARTSPAVRRIEALPVRAVLHSRQGTRIFDFGQNLVGRLRVRLRGPAGTRVTIRHAEVLEHGELGVRPLRAARATNTYILRGDGEKTWEPSFTFQGFRYAEITGLPEPVDPDAVEAVVIHSDMRRTGTFDCSHPLLNQLHENVVWGMRGNFLYLPTDCPQRDERLGWTGDIQVFAPTASFIYDSSAFLDSWLTDLALEQQAIGGGIVPFTVPHVFQGTTGPAADGTNPAAAWGDAATVVPTVLHERFGDRQLLNRQFESMQAWVDAIHARAGDDLLWTGGFQFGDWLDPSAPPDDPFRAITDPDLVATAYFYRSAQLTAQTAETLGRSSDAAHYGELAQAVHRAFVNQYVGVDAEMTSDSQSAYALAIVFGLHRSPAERSRMGQRLAELVRRGDFGIGTGFVGTPLICDALTLTGQLDVLERLLLNTANPSWLYPVTMGATTIWERWDSMLEDGTINPGEMTSFNHYALGAVADWLHRSLAGLAPASPGYRDIVIAPVPLPSLTHARVELETPYGKASSAWRREGDQITVEIHVPTGSTATVHLPGGCTPLNVASGHHRWQVPDPAILPNSA